MARKLFRSGLGCEKFTRHNEKNLVPLSQKSRTAIGIFFARVLEKVSLG
nr:hypothetical protein [Porphyromonas gulae]